MADKIKTGRAIIHFPYLSQSTGKTYNSILLSLEKKGKYSLPGGQFDRRKDSNTLDTTAREIAEELGLDIDKTTAKKVFTYKGNICVHDIYSVEASGSLDIDTSELRGVGFFNAGNHNQIPDLKLESHVKALVTEYFGTRHYKKTSSGIHIPGYYFKGNNNPKISDWTEQRKNF